MSLLPRHDPAVLMFRQVLEEFGTLDTLAVAVPVGGEEHLDLALATADAVAAALGESPLIERVMVQLDDPLKLAEVALRHAVLFLDEGRLAELERQLAPAGLAARAADIRASIEAPHGILGKELALRDPLGFLPMLLGQVSRTPASLKVDYSSGYYLSADHSLVVVLAKPRGAGAGHRVRRAAVRGPRAADRGCPGARRRGERGAARRGAGGPDGRRTPHRHRGRPA